MLTSEKEAMGPVFEQKKRGFSAGKDSFNPSRCEIASEGRSVWKNGTPLEFFFEPTFADASFLFSLHLNLCSGEHLARGCENIGHSTA